MNTKNIILVSLVIMLIVMSILVAIVHEKANDKENYINKLRVDTNYIYQNIKDDGLDIDVECFSETDDIHVTIIDLDEQIVFSNKQNIDSDSYNTLSSALYQDQFYIEGNADMYKISQPLYDAGGVVGFIIFEKMYMDDSSYHLYMLGLIAAIVIIVLILICWLMYKVFSNFSYKLLPIKNGIDDMTNGVYKKISIPQNTDYYGLYASYNKLVEEIGYINQKNVVQETQRKNFITMISHEIKTPLAAITAYSEALIKGVAKDKQTENEYIQVIYNRTKKLTWQVDDFFKYSQDEVNVFKYNMEECYADELIDEVFRNLKALKRENTVFHNDITKCLINTDKYRIEQVINNLYNNACKHTEDDDEIILSAYREDDCFVISVKDKGEGISINDLPHVFEYYYQGEKSREKDYEGIGLGLPICKQIIDAHGGKISIRSKLREGTEFTVKIPVA